MYINIMLYVYINIILFCLIYIINQKIESKSQSEAFLAFPKTTLPIIPCEKFSEDNFAICLSHVKTVNLFATITPFSFLSSTFLNHSSSNSPQKRWLYFPDLSIDFDLILIYLQLKSQFYVLLLLLTIHGIKIKFRINLL